MAPGLVKSRNVTCSDVTCHLMFGRERSVNLYAHPSEQYHSLGGVLGCHEAHVLAANVSSPRLYSSLYTSTINIRTVQLQLLIRCATLLFTDLQDIVVYSSDLRYGTNPVPRRSSTPDQPTLLKNSPSHHSTRGS